MKNLTNLIKNVALKAIVVGVLCFAGLEAEGQWTQVLGSSGQINCLVSNGNNVFAATQDSGVYMFDISGSNYVPTGLVKKSITSLTINGTNIFAGEGPLNGVVYNVYLSNDNGNVWKPINDSLHGLPDNSYVRSLFSNDTVIFAGTDDEHNGGKVYQSVDIGNTWTLIDSGLPNKSVTSFAINGTTIFVATYGGGLYSSTSNGINWLVDTNGLKTGTITALSSNGTNVFAGTEGYGVFSSANNGADWTEANNGLPIDISIYSLTTNGTNIFAGTDKGLFLSTNDAETWIFDTTGLGNTNVYSLVVSGENIFAGTEKGVWMTSLSEILSVSNITSSPVNVNIYPNPSLGKFNIDFDDNKHGTLMINNVIGQTIYKSEITSMHNAIDLSNQPVGIFIVTINSDGDKFNVKIIKE